MTPGKDFLINKAPSKAEAIAAVKAMAKTYCTAKSIPLHYLVQPEAILYQGKSKTIGPWRAYTRIAR